MIAATSQSKPLPTEAKSRTRAFTELIMTAISNAESREMLTQLTNEQAALRRVTTLMTQNASAATIFDAVATKIKQLLNANSMTLNRYEPDNTLTFLTHHKINAELTLPNTRVNHTKKNIASKVHHTQQTTHIKNYKNSASTITQLIHDIGVHSTMNTPIIIKKQL